MATRNFTLYGSSPDQLAQQQAGYERLFLGADERNMGAAERAAQINLNNQLRAQQQDEEARMQDNRTRVNLWQYGDQRNRVMQGDANQNTESRRRFDIGVDLDRERMDLAKAQRELERAEKKRTDAANLALRADERKRSSIASVLDYFAEPKPLGAVDFRLLADATGVPENVIRPLADRADKQFAFAQAAELNAALADAEAKEIATIAKANGGIIPDDATRETIRKRLKAAIELQVAEKHPKVKFNDQKFAWEVAGQSQPAGATATGNSPIAPLDGKVVEQDGKRYRIVNGMAEEL
jgi:hypothetical protein